MHRSSAATTSRKAEALEVPNSTQTFPFDHDRAAALIQKYALQLPGEHSGDPSAVVEQFIDAAQQNVFGRFTLGRILSELRSSLKKGMGQFDKEFGNLLDKDPRTIRNLITDYKIAAQVHPRMRNAFSRLGVDLSKLKYKSLLSGALSLSPETSEEADLYARTLLAGKTASRTNLTDAEAFEQDLERAYKRQPINLSGECCLQIAWKQLNAQLPRWGVKIERVADPGSSQALDAAAV